jgi:uncharacterized membrane protein
MAMAADQADGIGVPETPRPPEGHAPSSSAAASPGDPEDEAGEPRWPMAAAVLALMGLGLVVPRDLAVVPHWVPVLFQGVLLAALIVGDPGRIDRQARWIWRASILLVGLLLVSTVASTAFLVLDIVTGAPATEVASTLLIAGGRVWIANNIAFALLYWQLDAGGPAARAHGLPRYPALAFPQLQNPDLAPPGWRPGFGDYLFLAFTNANAFSPTDTPPLAGWAKLAMECQALLSFIIVGLVIARAINVFK